MSSRDEKEKKEDYGERKSEGRKGPKQVTIKSHEVVKFESPSANNPVGSGGLFLL